MGISDFVTIAASRLCPKVNSARFGNSENFSNQDIHHRDGQKNYQLVVTLVSLMMIGN